jgi:iron(III) transport system substrate-binding protein
VKKDALFINRMNKGFLILLLGFYSLTWSLNSIAQSSQMSEQGEWDKRLGLAKKEGRVVVSITTSAELRVAIEKHFEKRFGIDVEPVVGRAPNVIRRMIEESKGGVRYVDVHVGGSESIITGLLPEGILEAVEPLMLLPEVKDTKQWWGGHVWADNAKKFVYSSLAHQSESLWYNPQVVRPEEVRSYDDLLDEKWQNKIGLLDPRTPGSGASIWSYIREIKGEEYLKRLVAQKLLINRDQRLLAENLARGKISFVMGLGYYSYAPFLKAGLPVQPLSTLKEGTYISGGSGHLVALKNPPHPNAAKIFINWFLGREGQDVYSIPNGYGKSASSPPRIS